jgi:hypothetical protein
MKYIEKDFKDFTGFDVSVLDSNFDMFTLVTFVVDTSKNILSYTKELEFLIKQFVNETKESRLAEQILLRVVLFNEKTKEIHGFLPLKNINNFLYNGEFIPKNGHSLNNAVFNSVYSSVECGKQVKEKIGRDIKINSVVYVITGKPDLPIKRTNAINKIMKNPFDGVDSLFVYVFGIGKKDCYGELENFTEKNKLSSYVDLVCHFKNFSKEFNFQNLLSFIEKNVIVLFENMIMGFETEEFE